MSHPIKSLLRAAYAAPLIALRRAARFFADPRVMVVIAFNNICDAIGNIVHPTPDTPGVWFSCLLIVINGPVLYIGWRWIGEWRNRK